MKARPRTISIVASVVISALIFSLAITKPLMPPMTAPATRLAPMPSAMLPVALMTIAQSTPANATVEPIDKSKSREARQNIIVQATMPICETESARPTMFCHEKKYSTENESAAKRMAKISGRLKSSSRRSRRVLFMAERADAASASECCRG